MKKIKTILELITAMIFLLFIVLFIVLIVTKKFNLLQLVLFPIALISLILVHIIGD